MPIDTYLGDAILNWLKSTAFPSDPAAIYVSLWDGNPNSGGTDVTTAIDATGRKAVTFGTVAARSMANSADVDFGTSDGDEDVSWFAIHDASSGGNRLISFALNTPRSISTGDPVKFATGDLIISY
jgi:hypothetical protein